MKRVIIGDTLCLRDNSQDDILVMREALDEKDVCTVILSGKVNSETAYDVIDELFALLSVGKGIVLDLAGVSHLSPIFGEALVTLQARMENTSFESLPILNMPSIAYETLKACGCISSLDYELKEEKQ